MMGTNKVFFSVNDFDSDGDLQEKGVYIHFGDIRVRVADDLDGYKNFVNEIEGMTEEIAETYQK